MDSDGHAGPCRQALQIVLGDCVSILPAVLVGILSATLSTAVRLTCLRTSESCSRLAYPIHRYVHRCDRPLWKKV